MTEVSGLGTTHTLYGPLATDSIGVSLPGIEVKIAPRDGSRGEVPIGACGELVVRGPLVMMGYLGRPEATREVLGDDGWLRTGDIAYADESGQFYVLGRLKDMIVTAGYNVYPAEIERVICAHPGVTMAAVGKRADEVKGEVAVAYVVAAADSVVDVESVMAHCRRHLAAYKRPRDVVFVDALPTTSSGKLMRRKLPDVEIAVR
jgi:long-chain acyl-CoA synthetase